MPVSITKRQWQPFLQHSDPTMQQNSSVKRR